jgi:hypothetical protein
MIIKNKNKNKKNKSRIAKKRLTIPDEARAYRELSVDCCAIFLL